ncbi:MAG: ABC transporter permease [Thermoproteota archaeon]
MGRRSIKLLKALKGFGSSLLIFLRFRISSTIGFTIFVMLLIFGFVAPLFTPYDPRRWGTVPRDMPPCYSYILGTTSLGQDVLWLLSFAIKNSLILGIVASGVGLILGALLGLIAGYKSGIISMLILFIADTFIVLPGLPILILFSSLIKGQLNMFILGCIIGLLTWGMPVRNIRSIVLSLKEREFTYTAMFSGYNTFKIVFKEYLPYVIPWMTASFISRIFMAIGMEITLAIFGLSSLGEPTLGTIMYWAIQYQAIIRGIWWWISAPILAAVLISVSLYLLSEGINEYLDPRSRLSRLTAKSKKGEKA